MLSKGEVEKVDKMGSVKQYPKDYKSRFEYGKPDPDSHFW
jgi:hypothetical protein